MVANVSTLFGERNWVSETFGSMSDSVGIHDISFEVIDVVHVLPDHSFW